jgi:mannosyltransferase OCH1-like enzyme
MIPKIAHQTAKSKDLTRLERKLHDKLKQTLHDWQVILWDDDDNLRMVTEHFPLYVDVYKDLPFGVMKADIARYMYMFLYGGFYFDTDYEILRYIDDDLRRHRCVLPKARDVNDRDNPHDAIALGNAVMGSELGHPFWRDLLKAFFSSANARSARRKDIIAVSGPMFLTRIYLENLSNYADIMVPERQAFHPQIAQVQLDGPSRSYGVHHCFSSWHEPSLAGRARKLARRVIWTTLRARSRARQRLHRPMH